LSLTVLELCASFAQQRPGYQSLNDEREHDAEEV
jgi:hypothetical protein